MVGLCERPCGFSAAEIKAALEAVITRFETGELPPYRRYSSFPVPDIPAAKWDRRNHTKLLLAKSCDARTRKEWLRVSRAVTEDAKPIWIMVPIRSSRRRKSFGSPPALVPRAVFRFEDTSGKPLIYEATTVPELPLLEKAREWNVIIRAVPDMFRFAGHYDEARGEILLASPDPKVFWHELSHAALDRFGDGGTHRQLQWQEIIAELSACALYKILIRDPDGWIANSYQHIFLNSVVLNIDPVQACREVLSETENILKHILE